MKVTLLHYRYPPAVAGVELVLEQHARVLRRAGMEVTAVAGRGGKSEDAQVVVLEELRRDGGVGMGAGDDFEIKVEAAVRALRPWFEGADRVVVHNMLTMPFHMAATVAIWRLADELPAGRVINWVHDLAVVDPGYRFPVGKERKEGREGELLWPWCLLGRAHERVPTVAISEWRARQYKEVTGQEVVAVVPNGVEPLEMLPLTENVARLAREERLLEAEVVLFQPARVLARKRIELGLFVLKELQRRGVEARLVVTAAEDGHNADSAAYYERLRALREELGMSRRAVFVSEHFEVARADLLALYSLADVLWFPSEQEGFGLPVLEGALHRLPVFCANAPPMNGFGLPGMGFFDSGAGPEGETGGEMEQMAERVADQFLAFWKGVAPFAAPRKQVVARFSWDTIAPQLVNLLQNIPNPPV